MKHTLILFGKMEHGMFTVGGDETPMVIVYSIDERAIMDPVDVAEYMTSQGHDSYLIPDEFTGEVVFSQSFFKRLI
jgi:hypothetical protein